MTVKKPPVPKYLGYYEQKTNNHSMLIVTILIILVVGGALWYQSKIDQDERNNSI